MKLRFFLACLQLTALQAIDWNVPTQLFAEANLNSFWTQTAVLPTGGSAEAAWIVMHDDGITDIYTASCSSRTWGSAQLLTSSAHSRTALGLVVDDLGTYSLVCEVLDGSAQRIEAAYNSMGTWSMIAKLPAPTTLTGCFSLHVTLLDPDTAVVSWIDPSGVFQAFQYKSGMNGTPYPISASGLVVKGTQTAKDQAIFTTPSKTYASDLIESTPLKNKVLLQRSANQNSLCLATRRDRRFFAFQDFQTNFFLAVLNQLADFTYSLIATPTLPIATARLAIPPSGDAAAVIWQLTNGAIYASKFNGKKWGLPTMLSTNGSDPQIFVHPSTGEPVAIWADLSAGGTSNVVKSAVLTGGSWMTSIVSAEGLTFSFVNAAMDEDGEMTLIWCRQPTEESGNVVEATTSQ